LVTIFGDQDTAPTLIIDEVYDRAIAVYNRVRAKIGPIGPMVKRDARGVVCEVQSVTEDVVIKSAHDHDD
jgi:hypothetical protein